MSVFELDHIFVVFFPGASGNFISGVLDKLVRTDYSDLIYGVTGDAHGNSYAKITHTDHIACGMLASLEPTFANFQDKVQYHATKIAESYTNNIAVSKVHWTHDFTNIPVYKSLFPNSKILVVTLETTKEKLVAVMLQQLKNRMSENGFMFLKEDIFENHWKKMATDWMVYLIGNNDNTEIITKIINNRTDPRCHPLMAYVSICVMLKYYGISQHVFEGGVGPLRTDRVNHVIKCDRPVRDYISEDCVLLPFRSIVDRDIASFLECIENIYGTLTPSQIEFVTRNFNSYYEKQTSYLLDDPFTFFKQLEKTAFNIVEQIKNKEFEFNFSN